MSSGDPSAPCPSTAPSNSEKAIQHACDILRVLFLPEDDDDKIQQRLSISWFNVHSAISQAGDLNQKERLRNKSEFNAYVTACGSNGEQKRELIKLLRSMAKQEVPWRDLFQNEAFLKPEPDKITDPTTALATTCAWDGEFKGNLVDVLFDTIADYLSKDRNLYARLTTIVNSSGTGKSRMVDRLGTEVITVPMCIRQRRREGFPPVDMAPRDWLVSVSETGDKRSVQKRLHGISYSLSKITHRQLETIAKEQDIPCVDEVAAKKLYKEMPTEYVSLVIKRQKRLAAAFHEHMTKGQTYHTTNSNRRTFYTDVTNMVKQFVESSQQVYDEKEPDHGRYVSKGEGVQEAGEMLCRFIDERRVLESDKGPQRPLIVLAFDEADTLTDSPPEQENWNLFSELRPVLRQIQHLPIFSLFLSTAGRFEKFSPVNHSDPSARAREPDNRPLDSISETSFDDIACPALKGTIKLDSVVEIDWISHLGRPLFGSYWDNLPQEWKTESTIMDFVKQKLLDGPTELRNGNWSGSLACLSTRFALEFNMDGTAHDVTYAQVERHMRLCIAATTGFEKITISGSEPLLAEASYELMKGTGTNAVCHLAGHLDLNSIVRGRRGELVAALLIMQAYDAARVISGRRCVSVVNFMESLLPSLKYNTLLRSAPTSWPMGPHHQATFKAIFKDYGMWFNHIIKVEKKEMISIDHLWKFVVRGAMILCAANEQGVDIVFPVCHMTQNLGPDSVTAIIIQVKNAKDYKATLQADLFDAMDSVVKSAIFSKLREPGVDCDPDPDPDSEPTPAGPEKKKRRMNPKPSPEKVDPRAVIRIVFALASPEPAIVFRNRPEIKCHLDGFTTFDIWLAGLSDKTFRQIEDADLEHYKMLLEHSLAPHDAFELKDDPGIGKKAKKLRGARRQKMAPLTLPGHAHHRIHRNPKSLGEGSGGQASVAS